FAPGNTLISDLSPIASLSSLYVLELDSLENMDVSLLSTLTDAVGALKMDLESDTSRWNGTSESYCVGLCSLRSLEISGSDDSIGSDLSSFTSLLNNIAMCSGQCVDSYDDASSSDGTKVYPLSSTLTHLDLSSNGISDPTIVSLQPGLSGVTHLTLSDNSISDLALLQQTIDGLENVAYVDVSDNRLDCGSTVSECFETLDELCERDLSGDGVEIVFGDVDDPSGFVSQDTTSACGSDSSSTSSSSSSCSYLEDHRVCGVDYSVDDVDDTELACICGSGYYEDISSGECVLASSSSSSACSNCGGERGTCVYDADSSDESLSFCECSDEWYGTDCSSICPVSDDLGLCSGSSRGTCDAATHTCVCESGYYGSACQLSCSDDDSCEGNGTCSVGSFLDPSSSDPSSVSSEAIVCECSSGWYGSSCFSTIPTDVFVSSDGDAEDYLCGRDYSYSDSSDPTTASYSAYANESSSTCECAPHGLALSSSSGTCIDPATHPDYKDIDGNSTACVGCGTSEDSHGRCVIDESTLLASCACESGWTGDSCTAGVCPLSTLGELCSNNGECNITSQQCECFTDPSTDIQIWFGDACASVCPTNPITNVLCSGLGVCNPLSHECLCSWGFSGDACQFNMCAIGYGMNSNLSECFDHGSCSAGFSSKNEPPFFCNCIPGWGGMFCERDICWCDPSRSFGCATIQDGSRACKCKEGWYGRACERKYSGSTPPFSFF
ncbi:hypothetical protein ADUPG1_011424, partial [Aduncisulcus paluster]